MQRACRDRQRSKNNGQYQTQERSSCRHAHFIERQGRLTQNRGDPAEQKQCDAADGYSQPFGYQGVRKFMRDDARKDNQRCDEAEDGGAGSVELRRNGTRQGSGRPSEQSIDDKPAWMDRNFNARDTAKLPSPTKTHMFRLFPASG